ncbi:tryptophan 7-halogenase [Verrucomicrobiaceae bacterium R5-34]|nr:tryptophan 7-halogenase [Verrucomicrobiaceae bacterium R5-34]
MPDLHSENLAIAILGAGPAGCTLACFLALRGIPCVVFDDDKRPDLLVGESLVPAVVQTLKKLGIEERVADCSVKKPGASFFHPSDTRVHLKFTKHGKKEPGYAYNVPRPEFDNILRERAIELGVPFIHHRAKVQCSEHPQRDVELTDESLRAAGLNDHPRWLIDATGRNRLLARTLDLPADTGSRKDVAYFAHFDGFLHDEVIPGQIIISILDHGWAWRIPLRGKLSVGVVMDKKAAKKLGDTPEQRLETAIHQDPLMKDKAMHAKRITEVKTYTNYQLISQQGYGKGYILLGDAFGFVDPMLSPGLFMSLEAARLLDKHLFAKGIAPRDSDQALDRYINELRHWHQSWQKLIDQFYDGRILRMYEAGSSFAEGKRYFSPGKIMERHVRRVISSMASGNGTCSSYNQKLLEMCDKHMIWDVHDADFYAVK